MLANSKSRFIRLGLLGAIVALLVVGLLYSQSSAQTEEPDPAIENGALDISSVLLQAVEPLTISQDWFATAIVPPAFFFGLDETFSPNEFTFNAPVPVILNVTDDFCKGDRFQVFDNGIPIGMTSVPVDESPDCSSEVNPDVAFGDPTYSSGSFPLDSGFHHIRIKVIDSPFDGGRGYIEVHEAPVVFEYAAKIICGLQRDPQNMRLARGFYATAVNIHNPNDHTVQFSKKLALTFPPEEQEPGQIIPIAEDNLQPDEALEVDCMDIQRELFPDGFPTPYIKGFVVIKSPQSLDVVAVYTTASLNGQDQVADHSSIHVEQIRERVKEAKPRQPPEGLDHFKCYRTEGTQPLDIPVLLRDQFDTNEAQVLEAVFFCNPVEKIHLDAAGTGTVTPIQNEDHHLKLYRIQTAGLDQPRTVNISNQFGEEQKLEITNPLFLAVPTQKLSPEEHQPPVGLDHFKCYRADGDPVEALMDLNDQFHQEPQVKLGDPFALCNPVEKTHNNTVTQREHPNDHLMCYRIEGVPFETEVTTLNQFGDEGFRVTRAELLCVPSKKTILE